jgi:hypothetical protein
MRKYVNFSQILENPQRYSNQWVQSTARLKKHAYPSSLEEGKKYLFDLDTSDGQNVKLSLWESPPSWIPYPKTSDTLLKIFQGNEEEDRQIRRLFQPGEEVFFEGFLVLRKGVIWINVERILIASPSISIGSHEILGMLSCPRKYYLSYVKSVGGNILKWPDKNITRGNLVHTIIESVVNKGDFQKITSFSSHDKKERIRKLLTDQLNGEYRMDAALHILANTPLLNVEADIISRLTSTFDDNELVSFFTGKTLKSECRINQISGFSGSVDFIIDGRAFELKTATYFSPEHRWQLKIYLLNTLLETGINDGYLVYCTKTDSGDGRQPSKIHHYTINNDEIDQILYSRHQVLLQRKGMNLPDTFHRDCVGCHYKNKSPHSLQRYWPACQYYCQTERHWECYYIADDGSISTECLLANSCPVRNQYFDVERIDHFNKLRKAINSETEVLHQMALLLRNLPIDTLRACGQIVDGLRLETTNHEGFLFRSYEGIPCLDFSYGDQVIISTTDGLRYPAIFIRSGNDSILVGIIGNVDNIFFNKGTIYSVTKDYSESRSMRSLLRVIDFVQRGIHRQLPKKSKGKLLEKRDVVPYEVKSLIKYLEERDLVALQTTNQSSVVEQCTDIIQYLPRPCKILIVFRDSLEISEFISDNPRKQEILVIDRKSNFEKIENIYLISENNSPADIAEKINRSSIIVTKKGFLQTYNFFEKMHISGKLVPFDFIIVTSAEEYYEPQIYHLRSLAYHTLLIGDSNRTTPPIRSREARNSLGDGPFQQLVQYDSYFSSTDFKVFEDPFTHLPLPIKSALEHASREISVKSPGGTITFFDIEGTESGEKFVNYRASMRIEPADGTRYRLVLEPQSEISISSIDLLLNQLSKEDANKLKKGKEILIGEEIFVVTAQSPLGKMPDSGENSGENFEVIIKIPVRFSETLEELMYSNHDEAHAIIRLLTSMSPEHRTNCVIISPFISQVSKIKSLLYNSDLSDIPVLLPYQVGRKSYNTSIVSFVCSGNEQILRHPLTSPDVIYSILTSAKEHLILVGSGRTLRQSRILREIIDSSETHQMVNPSG